MQTRIFQRGGNRNRKRLVTAMLRDRDSDRLRKAIWKSAAIGLPLNRWITIHWERQGLTGGDAATATGAFLKRLRDGQNKRAQPLAYIWIRENDDGDGRKGDHVHIFVHLPEQQRLTYVRRWISSASGAPYRKGVMKSRSIGGKLSVARTAPAHYAANLATLAEYALKGASKGFAEAAGLGRWGEGGRVTGQRSGMSRNLSNAIRACSNAK